MCMWLIHLDWIKRSLIPTQRYAKFLKMKRSGFTTQYTHKKTKTCNNP